MQPLWTYLLMPGIGVVAIVVAFLSIRTNRRIARIQRTFQYTLPDFFKIRDGETRKIIFGKPNQQLNPIGGKPDRDNFEKIRAEYLMAVTHYCRGIQLLLDQRSRGIIADDIFDQYARRIIIGDMRTITEFAVGRLHITINRLISLTHISGLSVYWNETNYKNKSLSEREQWHVFALRIEKGIEERAERDGIELLD